MQSKHVVIFILIVSSFLFSSKIIATSWAYAFVVWNDYIFIVTDEEVTEIESEIGHVTKYSDMESFSGNFSNKFEKGTKYYSIKGVSTEEVIAIKESYGRYVLAYREGKYEVSHSTGGFFDGQVGLIKIINLLIIGTLVVVLFSVVKAKKNRK